ncbi:MAG: efflux RND transporter periplasmic adaptor subunit [Betaproteobacteria bacterium]|nr:efflux RND transporter periplasmic adaptor subunit [Betaproteobacteria bacterium]
MKKLFLTLSMLGALAAAAAGGYFWRQLVHPQTVNPAPMPAPHKILYWYDPMTPAQHFNHPGKSPFMPSMDLVPKYATQEVGAGNSAVIRIDPRVEQNLGLRTVIVRVGTLMPELRVPGILDWDRRRSVIISARTDGVLTRLFVRAPFDRVHAGQALGVLQSPSWSAAAAESSVLTDVHSSDAQSLRAAAIERLHVLGMSPAEIRQMSADPAAGVILRAPASGVISTLDALPGQSVNAGTTLMRIDDPSRLWLNAAIPQAEVAGIHAGTPAQIEIDAFPGRIFQGTVEAMLPEVDPRARTQTARIDLDNPDGVLAPGMFASVGLSTAPSQPHPLVPEDALISTGTQNRLILDLGAGHLEPRAVLTGRSAHGYTEVLAGLHGGERVVISGEFLFDSEADLNGALNRLSVPVASSVVPVANRHVLYWYDPMAPARHYSHGGPSPLMPSMNLVPQYSNEPAHAAFPTGAQP